ncbi:MAG: quinone-dependent dihydroorotate dehydrogenase [Verrucomicrobia bacterium]|nr:quinone-dependent dihydroorotate dehydrogenase [Verrucomicrobiota bacterium]
MDWYQNLLRPVFFCLDPEFAHDVSLRSLQLTSRAPALLRWFTGDVAPKPRKVFGLTFPNPVGLAAGVDKNAVAIPAWAALGFGFAEVGTVTAEAQPGNPKPRLFRYPQHRALVNRMGFNNDGACTVAARLRAARRRPSWPGIPVGINIGKTKVVPLEQAAEDYLRSFRLLREVGDYFVLNVSSPNTPGLRTLQERPALRALFRAVQAENPGKPMLVKIAPDLGFEQIEDALALVREHGLAGVIATNTTLNHQALGADQGEPGGLSGRPLRERSLEILRFLKARASIPVISAGGIMDVADARARFDAGADLIQLYTGFIYGGPALVREIVRCNRI